jgi:hypothetical protein
MRRHLLEPIGSESAAGVVRRLGAVLAMDESLAELAVRARRTQSRSGELAEALAEGRIIKTFAFRGATHYLSAEDGGAYLALRAASRMWELPSWQEYYDLKPTDWPAFREAVRELLADGPLTLDELGAAVTARQRFRHLRPVFDDGAGTLIKPLTWQGDMCFGTPRDGRHTFQRLEDNPHWAGIPELDDAGRHAVAAYFRTYGPATFDHVYYWLGDGLSAGRKRLQGWLGELKDRLMPVDIEGKIAYALRDDVDELVATSPSRAVRLLPGHDQWVIGAGTKDEHVVPPARRTPVTRKANIVLAGGVVSGTWRTTDDEVVVDWFDEAGRVPRTALAEEATRLGAVLGRTRPLTFRIA